MCRHLRVYESPRGLAGTSVAHRWIVASRGKAPGARNHRERSCALNSIERSATIARSQSGRSLQFRESIFGRRALPDRMKRSAQLPETRLPPRNRNEQYIISVLHLHNPPDDDGSESHANDRDVDQLVASIRLEQRGGIAGLARFNRTKAMNGRARRITPVIRPCAV